MRKEEFNTITRKNKLKKDGLLKDEKFKEVKSSKDNTNWMEGLMFLVEDWENVMKAYFFSMFYSLVLVLAK